MKSERVFLMELFLEEELPKTIKIMIKERFAEMDSEIDQKVFLPRKSPDFDTHPQNASHLLAAAQSPSMQRMMAQHPDLVPKVAAPVTPAAAQALAARQALLNNVGKEKPEDGRKSPRKI